MIKMTKWQQFINPYQIWINENVVRIKWEKNSIHWTIISLEYDDSLSVLSSLALYIVCMLNTGFPFSYIKKRPEQKTLEWDILNPDYLICVSNGQTFDFCIIPLFLDTPTV